MTKRRIVMDRLEYRIPSLPNFILPVDVNRNHIPVSALTDAEIELVIAGWSEAFREHARKRRAK